MTNIFKKIRRVWNWIWNSDSFLSWVIAVALIFVFVKFIFFPVLSLIMGTGLPLAGVESSSMDHQIVKDDSGRLGLCGKRYSEEEKQHIDFNEYWEICGEWYEGNDIGKENFSKFPLKNGFRKGDIIVVWGRFTPKIGDIIIFKPNPESTAPRPIIHRIVEISDLEINEIDGEKIYETKGDHNAFQLTSGNNLYRTDETSINEEQIIGKAVLRIPLLGWPKIWLVELLKLFLK